MQTDDLFWAANVPALHVVQLCAFDPEALPAGHIEHHATPPDEYVPTAQSEHVAAPSSDLVADPDPQRMHMSFVAVGA